MGFRVWGLGFRVWGRRGLRPGLKSALIRAGRFLNSGVKKPLKAALRGTLL